MITTLITSTTYRISSSKHRALNERRSLISAAPLGMYLKQAPPSNKCLPVNKRRIYESGAY